jgi:catechol 2,3-dioxygenase-like lactoylglutathione lyase family enzyme
LNHTNITMNLVPRIFRVSLQVGDLDRAVTFYSALLASKGRRIHGGRHYFDCGRVILALVDPTGGGTKAKPAPDDLYFAVRDLAVVHARCKNLGALARIDVHGEPGGEIRRRPWGERSFDARDPFGNELCFVDARTQFTGR